jgi:hypothetical protein
MAYDVMFAPTGNGECRINTDDELASSRSG